MKQNLRLLITGAGGPAAVSFLRSLSAESIVFFAADLDPNAAGLYLVPEDRRFLLPPGRSPGFVDHLLALCVAHRIDVLVPTVDCELLPVAEAQSRFEAAGIRVLLTTAGSLRLCLDKLETLRACEGVVSLPRYAVFDSSFSGAGWQYPLIVKPRSGSGSRGVMKVDTPAQLAKLERSTSILVQEYLPGEEYSVDVWSNAAGSARVAVPRTRAKVDSGITVTGCTIHHPVLESAAKRVAETLGVLYVANVQFRCDASGEPKLLEVNARFPGAMPLTVASGVHMPLLSLQELCGVVAQCPDTFRETAVVRFWEDRFFPPAELARMQSQAAESADSLQQELAVA